MKLKPPPPKTEAEAVSLLLELSKAKLGDFHALMHPQVSPRPFIRADHLKALHHACQRFAAGEVRRLAIAIPPRCFKSSVASIALPAYLLGHDPSLKIVCASYGLLPAQRLARESLQMMQSERYQAMFPLMRLTSANPALLDIRTTKFGGRFTTSVGGALTSIGADVIIVDDPLKAQDANSPVELEHAMEWLRQTVFSRLDKPNEGRILLVMQRLHRQDPIGQLTADGGWELLELPAETMAPYEMQLDSVLVRSMKPGDLLFEEVLGANVLGQYRHELGQAAFSAQYQQRPVLVGGTVFRLGKAHRFPLHAPETWPSRYEALLLSIDPAATTSMGSDYTAMTWWGLKGEHMDLLGAKRGRWEMPKLLDLVRTHRKRVSAVFIEAGGSGHSLHAMLSQDDFHNVWKWSPKKPKAYRAEIANLRMEQGHLRLPQAADWLSEVETELAEFPQGKNDDYVDSISQVPYNIVLLRQQLGLPAIPFGMLLEAC